MSKVENKDIKLTDYLKRIKGTIGPWRTQNPEANPNYGDLTYHPDKEGEQLCMIGNTVVAEKVLGDLIIAEKRLSADPKSSWAQGDLETAEERYRWAMDEGEWSFEEVEEVEKKANENQGGSDLVVR